MATTPQFIAVPNVGLTKYVNADGTATKTIFTPGGTTGSRIMAIVATSTDTAAVQFHIGFTRSGVFYRLDTLTIPGATSITPTTNTAILDPEWFKWLDANEPHMNLTTDITVDVVLTSAVSVGKEVSFLVFGGNF